MPIIMLFIRDMVKHELPVTSCKLRVENLRARIETQKYDFKSTSYEFKCTSYEFKSTSYEFKPTTYEFKSRSYELKPTSLIIMKLMKTKVNSLQFFTRNLKIRGDVINFASQGDFKQAFV